MLCCVCLLRCLVAPVQLPPFDRGLTPARPFRAPTCLLACTRPGDVAVVTAGDYARIKAALTPKPVKDEEAARLALHAKSRARAASWRNTVVGKHAAQAEAYRASLAAEEERKRAQDAEEARYQAAKRQAAIERANELLYYESDRVKGFHSGLLEAECQRERELQIELKKRKTAAIEAREAAWAAEQLGAADEWAEREEREFVERRAKQAALKQEHLAQAAARAQALEAERAEAAAEGEMVRRQAAEYAAEQARAAEARKARARTLQNESVSVNSHLVQLQKEARARERLEDRRIERHRAAVEAREAAKRERAEQIKAAREAQHEALMARQQAEADARRRAEFEWVERNVETAEARNAAEDARRRAALATSKAAQREQHVAQIAARKRAEAAERERELETLRLAKMQDEAAAAAEREAAAEKRREAQELARLHRAQAVVQAEQNRWDKTHDENQLAVDQAREAQEEARLEQYYAAVLAEAESAGVPTYAIKKAYAASKNYNPLRHA